MRSEALVLLIPVLLAAGAVHAAEVYSKDDSKLGLYGEVDGLYYFSNGSTKDGDQNYVHLGSKDETQINDQLTGCGQWEYNVQANNTESSIDQSWTRLAFARLKFADYGSFNYGRNYGVMYDVKGWTDMLPELGDDSYTDADNLMVGRANGVVIYCNTDFFSLVNGLDFAVQYQGNNEGAGNGQEGTNNGCDVHHESGDGWGFPITYDLSIGLNAGAACTSPDRTNSQVSYTAASGNKADAWTVGLKYDADDTYLTTMYSETRNITPFGDSGYAVVNRAQSFEVTAQYQFDFGLRPAVSFLMSKSRDLYTAGGAGNPAGVNDRDPAKYADVGAVCYFSRNMSTCVDYRTDLLDENDNFYAASGISTDDIVVLGLIYQF